MDVNLLEKISRQLCLDYLSVLYNPKNSKNGFIPIKTILLHDADKKILQEARNLMESYFSKKNETVQIVLEEEINPILNHNYRIDIGYFLENPPKSY